MRAEPSRPPAQRARSQPLASLQTWLCQLLGDHLSVGGVRIHFLEAGAVRTPDKRLVKGLVFDAYKYARNCLPPGALGNVDVVVQAQPSMTLPDIGIGGFSPSANLAYLFLDPSHMGLRDMLPRHLGATLVHELMHCARWSGVGYGVTLGDALVSEGLALHLEAGFRGEPPWYATSLDESQLRQCEAEARTSWQSMDFDRMAWFSPYTPGGPYRGYSLGYLLVGRRLAADGCTSAELYDAPSSGF